jgi:hypothetical protein
MENFNKMIDELAEKETAEAKWVCQLTKLILTKVY